MQGVEILAARDDRVLTDEALAFVAGLHRDFNPERERLLAARGERMARLAAGELPDFLAETASCATTATGASPRRPPTCRTAASRSPAPSTARW